MSNTACAKGFAHAQPHWFFSKENDENTGQAMAINAALPPVGEQHDTTVRSVTALLTYKLKNGETPPDTGYAAADVCYPLTVPEWTTFVPSTTETAQSCLMSRRRIRITRTVIVRPADIARASGQAIPCPYCS